MTQSFANKLIEKLDACGQVEDVSILTLANAGLPKDVVNEIVLIEQKNAQNIKNIKPVPTI